MFIDEELEGYILTCKISEDFKNIPEYSDEEFYVTVYKDESSDSGYYALLENKKKELYGMEKLLPIIFLITFGL